jgi:hypothetical protein
MNEKNYRKRRYSDVPLQNSVVSQGFVAFKHINPAGSKKQLALQHEGVSKVSHSSPFSMIPLPHSKGGNGERGERENRDKGGG